MVDKSPPPRVRHCVVDAQRNALSLRAGWILVAGPERKLGFIDRDGVGSVKIRARVHEDDLLVALVKTATHNRVCGVR
jgi:hypothetical protein